MNYRKFGKLDFDISAIGFGCMRFPLIEGSDNKVDIPETVKMLRYGIDGGINYIDTAYIYHGGESESIIGQALRDGYRQKVKLATKFPAFRADSKDDFDKFLDEQLKRLETDHIEFYFMHSLDRNSWENVILKFGCLESAERAKKAGKIGHIGFSFHDELEPFYKIVDGYDWELCLIQLNYLNEHYQQGLEGYKYLEKKGIPAVIMEPLLGGKLANLPDKAANIFKEANPERPPAEWAFDYLWDMPGIATVISGMSTLQQVEENIKFASRSSAGMLNESDKAAIEAVKNEMLAIKTVPCTKCNYCMPCPCGVDIPRNFEIYNSLATFGNDFRSKTQYSALKRDEHEKSANNCFKCGKCEPLCPQKIKIADELEIVKLTFDVN